jgi:hypothetical protein
MPTRPAIDGPMIGVVPASGSAVAIGKSLAAACSASRRL